MKGHLLFHIAIYYTAWFGGLILAANHYPWIASGVIFLEVIIALLWQHSIAPGKNQAFLLFAIVLTVAGALIDSLLLNLHILIFESNPFNPYLSPPWMILIWTSFAIFFYCCLKKFSERPYLIAILSFIGFPLAYYSGVKLGAAVLPYGELSVSLVGLIWMFLLPLILQLTLQRTIQHD